MTSRKVKPAIKEGLVTCVGNVSVYEDDKVVFADGNRLKPDLVIFATGFRYATEHLGGLLKYDSDGLPILRNCESESTPGLFLLGYKFGKSFASPFIRGIARDAKYIAKRIAKAK
jgi:NAD(P)H-nitrite reductase large subunit